MLSVLVIYLKINKLLIAQIKKITTLSIDFSSQKDQLEKTVFEYLYDDC